MSGWGNSGQEGQLYVETKIDVNLKACREWVNSKLKIDKGCDHSLIGVCLNFPMVWRFALRNHLVFDQGCASFKLVLGKVALLLVLLICASANRRVDFDSIQLDCRRNRSGQSTLNHFRTTAFNSMAATHSIENSYFHSISTCFNRSQNLVRDQGLYLLQAM